MANGMGRWRAGFELSDLAPCINWMVPYATVIREHGGVEPKSFAQVPADDTHNIQTHAVDLGFLVRATLLARGAPRGHVSVTAVLARLPTTSSARSRCCRCGVAVANRARVRLRPPIPTRHCWRTPSALTAVVLPQLRSSARLGRLPSDGPRVFGALVRAVIDEDAKLAQLTRQPECDIGSWQDVPVAASFKDGQRVPAAGAATDV